MKTRSAMALLLAGSLLSPAAAANWMWCCEHRQHPGSTPQERCRSIQIQFAKQFQCEDYKAEHDRKTGHKSKCRSA